MATAPAAAGSADVRTLRASRARPPSPSARAPCDLMSRSLEATSAARHPRRTLPIGIRAETLIASRIA